MRTTLSVLLLCAVCLAQEISQTRLRADLIFLASDALEGRLSLTRGSEAAIQFIAAEFAKAGLKPVVGDSYLQPVPLIEFRADPRESRMLLHRGGKTQAYESGSGFFGSFPNDVAIRAAVVFAGYGITASEYGYDDYAGLDVRGKAVLVLDHEPQETDAKSIFNGVGNTRHANQRSKVLNAQRHGAVAVLVMAEPNRKHPSNQERLARIRPAAQRARIPQQALVDGEVTIPSVSVSDALAGELLAGSGKKPADLQAAIDTTLKSASLALPDATIELRLANQERRRDVSYNVAGLLEGSDPVLKDETIIYTAHYDHDGVRDGRVYPGADDNASGTVGVIELARAYAAAGGRPKRSVLFVVFAAEERGLLGSYHYAAHPLRPLQTTRAVINFDMIGRNETPSTQTEGLIEIGADTSNEVNFTGSVYSPEYRAAIERNNAKVGLKLNYKWEKDAALNLFQRSDQFPFLLRDVPAVWWFTGFHPDYHQPTDSAEKINFVKMEKILRLAYLTGWEFASGAKPPRFLADPRAR